MDQFILERAVEGLGPRIVVANTGASHGADYPDILGECRVFFGGVLGAPVGVKRNSA